MDILFKPKIHKRFLLDFHKSVIAWLNAYILSAEFMEDEAQIYKEPLTDKWKNIEIRFTDDKIVKLIIDNKEEDSDYEKLGFADNRRNLFKKAAYVKSWSTLIIFSVRGGVIKMSEFAGDQKRKDLFIKSRLELSKRLMAYFGLPDDPIEYSQDKQAYKIKIKLTPSIDFRDSFLDQKKKIFESTGKSFLGNY